MEQRSVPKFGSFKPKKPTSDGTVLDRTQIKKSAEQEASSKLHNDSKHEQHRHASERRRRRDREHSGSDARRLSSTVIPSDKVSDQDSARFDDPTDSNEFMIDRVGDVKNIEYGSIHRYEIPPYRRRGCGRVVGTSSLKIDQQKHSNGAISLLDSSARANDERKSSILSSTRTPSTDEASQFVSALRPELYDWDADFVTLSVSNSEADFAAEHPSFDSGVEQHPIRYNEDESKQKHNASALSEQRRSPPPSFPRKDIPELHNATLLRKVRSDPQDLHAWLALSSHQSKLLGSPHDRAKLTTSERQILANLRISILKDALEHFPNGSEGRTRLTKSLLEEGRHIWEQAELLVRWSEALHEEPHNGSLWLRYTEIMQHDIVPFHYNDCYKAYVDALQALSDNTESDRDVNDRIRVEILLRLTSFLRAADYIELAMSIWQIVLEYHFNMPSNLVQSSISDRLLSLERFWDGDVPRIGELGAQGWHLFEEGLESTRTGIPGQEQTGNDMVTHSHLLAQELREMHRCCLPAPADSDDVEDPFRFVLFADVRKVVELLADLQAKHDLCNAFLTFFGLPSCFAGDAATSMPTALTVMAAQPINRRFMTSPIDSQKSPLVNRYQQETVDSLFDGHAFEAMPRAETDDQWDKFDIASFVDRAVDMLATRQGADDLAEYHIALRLRCEPSSASKLAKRYLHEGRRGLRLANAYALVEARQGRIEKADRLWTTALRNRQAIPGGEDDVIIVSHSAAFFYLEAHRDVDVLRYLAFVGEVTPDATPSEISEVISKVLHLRVRRELENVFDRLYLNKPNKAVLAANCITLLAYLASGHEIADALTAYEDFEPKLVKTPFAAESLAQGKARLIRHHLDERRPFKPQALLVILDACLEQFPNNSSVMNLYHQITQRDRIRLFVEEQRTSRRQTKSAIASISKLIEYHQQSETGLTGSNANSLRKFFADTLLDPDNSCRYIPQLWFAWLHFEKMQVNASASAVKAVVTAVDRLKRVLFAGLKQMPGMKLWILIGMMMLGDHLTAKEQNLLYNMLPERGLRTRFELLET